MDIEENRKTVATHISELRASNETLKFHHDALVFDCLSLYYVLDEPYAERILKAGVNAVNVTISSESHGWDEGLRRFETAFEKIEANPNLVLASNSNDIIAAKDSGKLAIIPGLQGSWMIGPDIYRVEILHRLGLRFFGPAYTGATVYCDGCGETRNAGLSYLGRELIECLNDLGMLVDLSHVGHQSRLEIAEKASHPVCTHSNSYFVNPNDRNTKDETASIISSKGGVMGVCALPKSVAPDNPKLDHMLDHVDHYSTNFGHQNVGIGLDFVEAYKENYWAGQKDHKPPKWRVLRPDIFGSMEDFFYKPYPLGIESISLLPNLTQGLFDRGYNNEQVAGIIGGNWFRKFKEVAG
jgi:membrane dipeptidase